jgi:hypothetical protein
VVVVRLELGLEPLGRGLLTIRLGDHNRAGYLIPLTKPKS